MIVGRTSDRIGASRLRAYSVGTSGVEEERRVHRKCEESLIEIVAGWRIPRVMVRRDGRPVMVSVSVTVQVNIRSYAAVTVSVTIVVMFFRGVT